VALIQQGAESILYMKKQKKQRQRPEELWQRFQRRLKKPAKLKTMCNTWTKAVLNIKGTKHLLI